MAVSIRLRRTGAKNDACFRIVAADRRSPRDGRFIEILGWYDPKRESDNFDLKLERVEHWVAKGACISDTVKSLVSKARKKAADRPEPVAPPVPAAPTTDHTESAEQSEPAEEAVASE